MGFIIKKNKNKIQLLSIKTEIKIIVLYFQMFSLFSILISIYSSEKTFKIQLNMLEVLK